MLMAALKALNVNSCPENPVSKIPTPTTLNSKFSILHGKLAQTV